MAKTIHTILVALLLVMLGTSTASAARGQPHNEVPVKGTVTGEHEVDRPPGPDGWIFTSSGTGQMSHLGRVDYSLEQASSFGPDGVISSTGTITFTAANGDELVVAQEATSQIVGPGEGFTLEGTWTVVSGSGRFTHAMGSGSLDGVGDIPGGEALFGLPDGFAEFNLRGEIAYDASNRTNPLR